MILCSDFPTRECEDKGQSSTMWLVGELSISSLNLVRHGRTPGKALGQATVTAHTQTAKVGVERGTSPLAFAQCRRLSPAAETHGSGLAVFLDD